MRQRYDELKTADLHSILEGKAGHPRHNLRPHVNGIKAEKLCLTRWGIKKDKLSIVTQQKFHMFKIWKESKGKKENE